MDPLLVIMAAGLGSRFGGVKQLARVGRNGEAFIDFSINDALAAGFGDVVLIVRSEIEDDVAAHLAEQHPDLAPVMVRQDDFGPSRAKPWGTLHALLSAGGVVDRPFAAINADDYYGPTSFELARRHLAGSRPRRAGNVAFRLEHTVPAAGAVTRALCEVDHDRLTAIVETTGCERLADGTFVAGGHAVPADTAVSMNLWTFDHSVMADFDRSWQAFYQASGDDPTAECQLPTVVGQLMHEDLLTVDVVPSAEQWIGVTNPEDLERAQAALADR